MKNTKEIAEYIREHLPELTYVTELPHAVIAHAGRHKLRTDRTTELTDKVFALCGKGQPLHGVYVEFCPYSRTVEPGAALFGILSNDAEGIEMEFYAVFE